MIIKVFCRQAMQMDRESRLVQPKSEVNCMLLNETGISHAQISDSAN